MYHYHKKTHEDIPEGTLCSHGCGQVAKLKNTRGNYICSEIAQRCPAYILNHSHRIKEHWERPESIKRKEETKERFFLYCCGVPEVVEKQKKTKKKKWGNFTPDQMRDFRHYARRIRTRAQSWARSQGYILGQQTFHVDHMFSVRDAWIANVSEEIVNHPANLQVIEAKKNSSKGCKSSITLDELLRRIDEKV
jgi:hypothetical protein